MFWSFIYSPEIFKGSRTVIIMIRFTYALVDLSAIVLPFLFSFHPKIKFYKEWKSFFPALILSAVIFIIWDIIFTNSGVWEFNDRYLMGYYFFSIPVEEILFFICIPYACVFTYHCFETLIKPRILGRSVFVSSTLLLFLGSFALIYHSHLYTSVTFSGLFILIFYNTFVDKADWLKLFYISYLVLLIPFFICNGILTGTGLDQPVVIYNDAKNLGLRLFTIPVEDVFYGMLLILLNITIYEKMKQKV